MGKPSLHHTTFLILFIIILFLSNTSESTAKNSNLFREYIGALFNGVKFTDVPINSADSTLISVSPSALEGTQLATHLPILIRAPSDSWVDNAVSSLTKIIKMYHLDGIDVDYEHFKADEHTFAQCIGRLITNLKKNNVIQFASIAPFDDPDVQGHYQALWKKYKHVINYNNYNGGKILTSFLTQGSGGLAPNNGFFTACQKLKDQQKLYGIFIRCADSSMGSGFKYKKQSQKLLASSS
ncbi:hypothetical protein Droror1_Dr00004363 [Drosera rotundifolia]